MRWSQFWTRTEKTHWSNSNQRLFEIEDTIRQLTFTDDAPFIGNCENVLNHYARTVHPWSAPLSLEEYPAEPRMFDLPAWTV